MATTRTPNAALQLPGTSDRGWNTPLNENATALDALAAIGGLCVTQQEYPSTSLMVNVAAGTVIDNSGVYVSYAGVLGQAIPASVTRYLYLDNTGTLVLGTAWPTAGTWHFRLAVVTTDGSTITSLADQRTPWRVASS